MTTVVADLINRSTHTVTDYSMGIDSSFEELDKERLVLLTVQECISIIRDLTDSTSYDDPVKSIIELQAQQACYKAIRDHFRA